MPDLLRSWNTSAIAYRNNKEGRTMSAYAAIGIDGHVFETEARRILGEDAQRYLHAQ